MKVYNPTVPPLSFSHGIEVPASARTLYISGQTGGTAEGDIPEGIEAQTAQTYLNILAVLQQAGMGYENIVKSTIYLVDEADWPGFSEASKPVIEEVRSKGGVDRTATLVIVKSLLDPRYLVEIETIAVAE